MYFKMYKTKMNSIVILFLMIITGFIIYYMYLKPETFDCITNPSDPECIPTMPPNMPTMPPNMTTIPAKAYTEITKTIPKSIVSRYFGVGFNVYPVVSSASTNQMYLIEHIPITFDGISGGYYAISNDGLFTIKIKNKDDSSQWWTMTELIDSTNTTNNSVYQIIQPFNASSLALQYANGSISITPYRLPGFESQKWLKSENMVTRGIPVLNVSPASMFTTEFDPYSSPSTISTNLSDSNNTQINTVINAVKTGIQQYLSQISPNNQITSSALGNKQMPLSVNLNLNSAAAAAAANSMNDDSNTQGISFFDNVTGSTSTNDMLSILDKYDSNSNTNNDSQTLYTTNSLENQLNQTSNGCKLFNINDYMSNRVSTCNCKL